MHACRDRFAPLALALLVSLPPGQAGADPSGIQPAAGDWVVYQVEEQARKVEWTLRAAEVKQEGVRWDRWTIGPGAWKESRVRSAPLPVPWEDLPDLLLGLLDLTGGIPLTQVQRQQCVHRPEADGALTLAGPGPDCAEARPLLCLKAEWRGTLPGLQAFPVELQADLWQDPARNAGGLVRAILRRKLQLPSGRFLREEILVQRVREGDRSGWKRERARYLAR